MYAVKNTKREPLLVRGGALKLVVVADTHSEPHARAAKLIAREKPDRILHAGDIGELGVIDALERIAPTSVVRGNIDVHAAELPDALTLDLIDEAAPDDKLLTILLLHIAVNGPKLRADAARRARTAGAQLVICGHSHVPFIGRDRGLSIFNPGSIGPRRFHLPIVFGVMELAEGRLSLKHVDCETGEQWLP